MQTYLALAHNERLWRKNLMLLCVGEWKLQTEHARERTVSQY